MVVADDDGVNVLPTVRRRPAVQALFQLPLSVFTSQRNLLAKSVRAAGDTEGSAAIKALSKPSASAWAVNRLQAERSDLVGAMLDGGDEVRRALSLGDPELLQAAIRARRDAIADAAECAIGLLAESGNALAATTIRRLRATLEALATRGRSGLDDLVLGALSEDLPPPGFDALSALAGTLPDVVRPPATASVSAGIGVGVQPTPPSASVEEPPDVDPERERQAKLADARADIIRAQAAVERALRRLNVASVERRQAVERARAAAAESAEAERRVIKARERAQATAVLAAEAEAVEAQANVDVPAARLALENASRSLKELEDTGGQ